MYSVKHQMTETEKFLSDLINELSAYAANLFNQPTTSK